jgi:hypothetical protein
MAYPQLGLWRSRPGDGAYLTRMNAAEATYGPVAGHWAQYHDPGSLPLDTDADAAIAAGKRLHVHWKPYPAGQHWVYTANGNYNTQIIQTAQDIKAKAPAQIWLTLHHEPEFTTTGATGNFSWSAYRSMWQVVRSIFTAQAVNNVVWVAVFANSHTNTGSGAGQAMLDLYGSDGVMDGLVDIIGLQDPIGCAAAAASITTRWGEDLAFLTANAAGGRQWQTKSKLFSGWGADDGGDPTPCGSGGDRGTDQHRADTITAVRGFLPNLEGGGVVELRYDDANSNALNDTGPDGTAFQALKDTTENYPSTSPQLVSQSGGDSGASNYAAGAVPTTFEAGYTAQAGDTAFLAVRYGSSANALATAPTGYAPVPISGVTWPFAQAANSYGYLWRKTLTGAEAAPSFTFSGTATGGWDLLVYRGVGTGTYASGATAGTSTSVTLPTLTGVHDNAALIAFVSARTPLTSPIPTDITPDPDYQEVGDHATSRDINTAQNNLRLQRAVRTITTGGTYGGDTFTVSGGTSHSTIAFLVEVLAGQAASVTLPITAAELDPTVATPEDHAKWHNAIDVLLPHLDLPTVTTSSSAHLRAHELIHADLELGLDLDPVEGEPDHPEHHRLLHLYLTRGPQAGVVAPAGAVTVAPGASISSAITTAGNGGTVYLQAGLHRLASPIQPRTGQTIMGEYGAIVDGSVVISDPASPATWTTSGSQVWAPAQLPGTANATGVCEGGGTLCQPTEDVYLDGVQLDRVGSAAAVGPGQFFGDYAANRIYLHATDSPATKLVEQAKCAAFVSNSTGINGGVTIKNLHLRKWANPYQNAVVAVNHGSGSPSNFWTVEQNLIEYGHADSIKSFAHYTLVRRNILRLAGSVGVGGFLQTNMTVEANEIINANTRGFDDSWEAGGIKLVRVDDAIIRGNRIADNFGTGLWIDIDSRRVDIWDNGIFRNTHHGLHYEISYDGSILRNLIFDNTDGGVQWNASAGGEVRFNTVSGNGWGMRYIADPDRLNTDPPHYPEPRDLYDVVVSDNKVTHLLTSLYAAEIRLQSGASSTFLDEVTFNRDAYILTATNAPRFQLGVSGSGNLTFAQWQAAGKDTDGTVSGPPPPPSNIVARSATGTSAALSTNATTGPAISADPNVQNNDILILAITLNAATNGSVTITSGLSGWTLLGTKADVGSNDLLGLWYWRRWQTGDPTSWTPVASASQRWAMVMSPAYGGCHATTPIGNTAFTEQGANTTTHSSGQVAVTAGQIGAWLVSTFASRTGVTWTPPAGFVERADIRAASGLGFPDAMLSDSAAGMINGTHGPLTGTASASTSTGVEGLIALLTS